MAEIVKFVFWCTGSAVLSFVRSVTALGHRYNPYDLAFLSMPRPLRCRDILANPLWRRRIMLFIHPRVGASLLEFSRSFARLPLSKAVHLGLSSAVVLLCNRLSATMSADCSNGFSQWRHGLQYAFRSFTIKEYAVLWAYTSLALTLESEVPRFISKQCSKSTYLTKVRYLFGLLPASVSWMVWARAETLLLRSRTYSLGLAGRPQLADVVPTIPDLQRWEIGTALLACAFHLWA